jgi:regulator of sirC expression with transglutaminase-like and TPR domain
VTDRGSNRVRFAEAGRAPEEDGRLAEAALCIAAEADGDLDVDATLGELAELGRRCPPELEGLRRLLFDELGFRGNRARYDDARNSFLNAVLDRRLGIPISLAVLAIEVGRHAGVELRGVNLPGHFIARTPGEPATFLDAFSGRLLDVGGVRSLYSAIAGGVDLDPSWLRPADNPTILRRMLNNLRAIFARHLRDADVLWTLELDLLLPTPADGARLTRAAVLARLHRVAEAESALTQMAEEAEEKGDRDGAAVRAREAKAVRALLN